MRVSIVDGLNDGHTLTWQPGTIQGTSTCTHEARNQLQSPNDTEQKHHFASTLHRMSVDQMKTTMRLFSEGRS